MKNRYVVFMAGLLLCFTMSASISIAVEPAKEDIYRILQSHERGIDLTHSQSAILLKSGIEFNEPSDELDREGGPDGYGYIYYDSDDDSGAEYEWIDITETGTEVAVDSSLGDDDVIGPFEIGFTFSLYDNEYTQLWIQSNGMITFHDDYHSYFNYALPHTFGVENAMIAWFWDDLDPDNGNDGLVYHENTLINDNEVMVISLIGFDRYPDGDDVPTITAQVLLYDNGKIKIQYQQIDDGLVINSSSIGIQDESATYGLTYLYNGNHENYPHNELAVVFELQETIPPTPPTGLEVVTAEDGMVTVVWNTNPEEENITGYMLYYDTDMGGEPYDGAGAFEGESPIDVGPGETYTLSGLSLVEDYYIDLKAYNEADEYSEYAGHVVASFNVPELDLQVYPLVDPLVVPSEYSRFYFDAVLINNADWDYEFDAWINLVDSNGDVWHSERMERLGLVIPALATYEYRLRMCVPGIIPDGECILEAFVGYWPDEIIDSDQFGFLKGGEPVAGIRTNDRIGELEVLGWEDVEEKNYSYSTIIPSGFAINHIYPNPFNPSTTVELSLPSSTELQLAVYNMMGQEVAVLASGRYTEGYHSFTFNANGMSSGIYFVRASASGYSSVMQKVMLVK